MNGPKAVFQALSGRIKVTSDRRHTVVTCDELPLGGNSDFGVSAIAMLFTSVFTYARHCNGPSEFLNKLTYEGELPIDGVRFSISFGEPVQSLIGVVTRLETGNYTGYIEHVPIQYSCPSLFATIEALLSRSQNYYRSQPHPNFGAELAAHLRAHGQAEFRVEGNKLGQMILRDVEGPANSAGSV